MGNESLKIENGHSAPDRRKTATPISHDRRCGMDRRMSFREKLQQEQGLVYALESIPPIRRIACLPEKIDNGDLIPALGMAGLAFINIPEDMRDIKNAVQEVKCLVNGNKCIDAYNYKNCQHEFSFFRGTFLEHLIDEKKSKNPELTKKITKLDESFIDTGIGKKIMKFLKVKISGEESIKIFDKKTNSWGIAKDINGRHRYAYIFEGGSFAKITARAMLRTTMMGVVIVAAMELPKIIKSMFSGKNIKQKADNTASQVVKSGINVAATTAGIAYCGAIGSKYGKSFGSLVGMGVGAVIGNIASNKIQDLI